MGKAALRKRQSAVQQQAEQPEGRQHAAAQIEQTLRALIVTAEGAELRFLAYLLRMAQSEAGDVSRKRGA